MSNVTAQPKGTPLTRIVICLAKGKGDLVASSALADAQYGPSSQVAIVMKTASQFGTMDFESWPRTAADLVENDRRNELNELRKELASGGISDSYFQKAAVAAGSTTSLTWASPLAAARVAQDDYMAAVAARSVLGRLTRLRRQPANMVLPRQIGRVNAGWVGEGKPVPVTKPSTDTTQVGVKKVGTIITMSSELMTFSDTRAEALVRDDLVNAGAGLGDQSFLDPAEVGADGEQPASITSSLVPLASSGNVLTDLEEMINAYQGDLDTAVFISDKLTAVQVGLRNSGSQTVMVGAKGGECLGIPWLVSDGMPRSSTGGRVALFDQAQVALADEGATVDFARDAALQLDTSPAEGATSLRSLWQNNLVAFKLQRLLDWSAPAVGTAVLLEHALY